MLFFTSQIWSLSLRAYFDYWNQFQTVGCEENKYCTHHSGTSINQYVDSGKWISKTNCSNSSSNILIKTGFHIMFFQRLHQLCCSLPYSIIYLYIRLIIIMSMERHACTTHKHIHGIILKCVRKTTSMHECCPEHNFQHCWHTEHFYHP